MMKSVLAAVALVAMVPAVPAVAQDASQSPVFGAVTLSAGFEDDPLQRRLRAGGPNNASRLPGVCAGYVGTASDFRVTYTAGRAPLIFRSMSPADKTLVVTERP